jgi:predicted phosphoribosyltransferase
VIVVDDGLATGATMIAALHAARSKQPERLVCAVPVAAPDSLERVRPYADEVVCLEAPEEFFAVGQFYREFGQVEDDEVVDLLARPPKARAKGER